ncbi:MAG TPA: hypothetical protein VML75_12860 [Kofleriaceae bacterium]|nr:hypothetical protein [Kofleriaceae bacterium]
MANSSAEPGITIGWITGAAVLGLGLFYLRFCGVANVPAAPPPPPVMRVDVNDVSSSQSSSEIFAQRVAADSERWSVRPPATPESLGAVLAHRSITQRLTLRPGKDGSAEINGLRLEALSRGKTLGLRIENLADHPVAYRIATRPDRGTRECRKKENWAHNAMALRERGDPAAVTERSECGHQRGKGLVVTAVEVIALEPLSYHYLSRLTPSTVGVSDIAVSGHRLPPGPNCSRKQISGVLESAMSAGRTTWRDLIDFYARHSCLQYDFPSNYKAFEGPGRLGLPAVPPG